MACFGVVFSFNKTARISFLQKNQAVDIYKYTHLSLKFYFLVLILLSS